MPNPKVLEEKKAIVDGLAEKMQSSAAGVFVDYKGINVEADTALRAQFRENGVDYSVIKNTLTRFAANRIGYEALDPILHGTTALAVSKDDPVISAKLIYDYSKKNQNFKIKAGFVDSKVITPEEVVALAQLPPREVLIAQVLGTMNAPITGFATVLNANIRGLAVALKAIAEKKSA